MRPYNHHPEHLHSDFDLILMPLSSAVSIAPRTEVISPLILGNRKEVDDLDLDQNNARRSKRNSLVKAPSKRLTGRLPYSSSPILRPNSGRFDESLQPSEPDSSNSRSESRHSGHNLDGSRPSERRERIERPESMPLQTIQKSPSRTELAMEKMTTNLSTPSLWTTYRASSKIT